MTLHPPFRLAVPDDARTLAQLVNFAGDGLPLHLWIGMAGPDGDPWAIGAARQAAKASKGEIIVADEGEGAVAALTGYVIGPRPAPLEGLPEMFVPLQQLENLAPQSWYVNVIAALPEHRRRGWGGRLLELAESIARDEGARSMSIIVADANDRARRLYERTGYREKARRRMVKDGWRGPGRDWVLLIKPLD